MFENPELQKHLQESSVIRTQSAIIAEWNMNIPENISRIGNYRYRPKQENSPYKNLPGSYDPYDSGTSSSAVKYYTNATDADVVIDGGFDDSENPFTLSTKKEKIGMLYSLEDCFSKFRPRSGINKSLFLRGKYLHHSNIDMARRPRYYMGHKDDLFKYWSSYRTEDGVEYGISSSTIDSAYPIEDACPFIVYKEDVPANRVVVKMQTHVGNVDLGTFSSNDSTFSDPFYGDSKSKTPKRWKIQGLQNGTWTDLYSFNEGTTRRDGTAVIKHDGYVELSYGLKIPDSYRSSFIFAETYSDASFLPEKNIHGYAYLIQPSSTEVGTFYIWQQGGLNGGQYATFKPEYAWQLEEETIDRVTNFVTDLTDPVKFYDQVNLRNRYREFDYIKGIRIVIESMNTPQASFDLIEISPRLCVNLSDKTLDFSIAKSASDLGISGLPVGQLLASTGTLNMFDHDSAFNPNNLKSIISKYITRNIQIKFYDITVDVDGYDYFVPLKTMYSEGFPTNNISERTVSLSLRDMFFYFESITAPELLVPNVSVSTAVCMLLDYAGFSNYVFKRLPGETESVIPFFFSNSNKTIAEVLQDIAISTQTAMFFDEYNNFVMMSKNYFMPSNNERATDVKFLGTNDLIENNGIKNMSTSTALSNIIEITSEDNQVYNDGKINFTSRYIQKTFGSIKQASLVDNEKTWVYKPVLLWEVSGTETTKSVNNQVSEMSDYVLSAIPLNSNLTDAIPYVAGNKVVNNTMNFGEGIYWLARYNGYFYSNGEVIKFDAVEFSVSGYGNVWITNVQEYQNYFSKLKFGGSIFPTGLVRIYAEPNYIELNGKEYLQNGPVAKHGRGQFNTTITSHFAGLSPYWSDNNNVRGCTMQSKYLFQSGLTAPETEVGAAGVTPDLAKNTTRNGVIKNFLSTQYYKEADVANMQSTSTGTIQSSALIMAGPSFKTSEAPLDFISYVYKPMTNKFTHFGTRMRIVGKIENNADRGQTAVGATSYYLIPGTTPDKDVNIVGGSGGLGIMVNPETNNGYFLELIALGKTTIDKTKSQDVNNVIFYKVKKDSASSAAIPEKLYAGLANIVVDDGKFTGQYRMAAEKTPTVYDISIEYENIGNERKFYIYLNNQFVASVIDKDPLPVFNNMALFTRGSSRVMFENIYAIGANYGQNSKYILNTPTATVFDEDSEVNASESMRKYAMSGIIQSTYLTGISSYEPPQSNLYFEEFGTIMREASVFKIKYEKAYPAIYAQLSPTFNSIKGYAVSGFRAGAYGAEFIIFNATDKAITLDAASGNYLRIQGVTFTQETDESISVDEYYSKNSDFSKPQYSGDTLVSYPNKVLREYEEIKISRMTHGKKDFSLDTPYIQSKDEANYLMSWLTQKIIKPRKSIGLKIFANPTIQLGDIAEVDYYEGDLDYSGTNGKKFVVYSISYSKSAEGPSMEIYLSEVV